MAAARRRISGETAAPLVVVLVMLLCASMAPPAAGDAITVGGKRRWSQNVNYTEWAAGERFFLGDWLVFRWAKGYYDVMQVNATDYASCSAEHPITNWSRGDRWAIQLNRTGPWYFICSRGYCWGGMKLNITVHPLPLPPSLAPVQPSSAAPRRSSAAFIAATLIVIALL